MNTPKQPHTPTEAQLLRNEITAICHQTDRRLGNPPGTAEQGLYFWLWPPTDLDAETLTNLHTSAVKFLHDHLPHNTP